MILRLLPPDISFLDATRVAGKMGNLNVINFEFDLKDKYNVWSGLIGGTFLALSYFGTDQSQVQRYLSGRSIAESRLGLLANGMLKIPMQFCILFIGAMIFVFYQFVTPPLFFNPVESAAVRNGAQATAYENLESEFEQLHDEKQVQIREMLSALDGGEESEIKRAQATLEGSKSQEQQLRREAASLIAISDPGADTNDINYIFLSFVINYLPVGLVGLILAAILSASMSSTAAELNALASVSVIDIYRRVFRPDESDHHYLTVTKIISVFWGAYAIGFAMFANSLGSLIEAVNILGSLFYGSILGIFLIAFSFKKIGGDATFIAAIIAEALVLACFFFTEIPYLWFNVIGCVVLIAVAFVLNPLFSPERGRI
jgi:Na+/proline symporter